MFGAVCDYNAWLDVRFTEYDVLRAAMTGEEERLTVRHARHTTEHLQQAYPRVVLLTAYCSVPPAHRQPSEWPTGGSAVAAPVIESETGNSAACGSFVDEWMLH